METDEGEFAAVADAGIAGVYLVVVAAVVVELGAVVAVVAIDAEFEVVVGFEVVAVFVGQFGRRQPCILFDAPAAGIYTTSNQRRSRICSFHV